MKELKKLFALLLIFPIVLFSACGKGGGNESFSDSGENEISYIRIVENGRSDYAIVIPSSASDCEIFAADELSSFVREITGAVIPVKEDSGYTYNPNQKVISIGKTNILKTSGVDTEQIYGKLNLTGFYIEGRSNTVIIDAYKDVGVLYGVYEVLEKYGGVRFVTEDYTYVPEAKDFYIAEGEQIEAPAFQLRTYLNGVFYTDKLFMARKRFGNEWGNKNEPMYGGGNDLYITGATYTHDTLLLCDPTIYMAKYPQMFNIVNGVAREICMTYGITEDGHIDDSVSVSAATVILGELKKLLAEYPEKVYFFVGQEDHNDYCTCETCMRRTEEYGSKRSSLLVIFMNAILEELTPYVEETYPGRDVRLATFAYHYTEEAPVIYDESSGQYSPVNPLCVPDKNLYIRIAPIDANFMYSFDDERQSATYLNVFRGWQAITNRFWIWDYATNYADFNFIFPNIAAMQENYRYYRDMGVAYCMTQANHRNIGDFQERLKIYVVSKLMWNPDLEADALVNEFFSLYFGKYAEKLLEFWNIWNRHLSEIAADPSINFYLSENNKQNVFSSANYPLALLEKSIELINDAIDENAGDSDITAAERDAMRKRLLGALVIPERMILRNVASYYGTTSEGELAKIYFGHIEEIGQTFLSEFTDIKTAKANYGL